jgi:hypothetical protein
MLALFTIITALFAPLMTMGVLEMRHVRVSDTYRFLPVIGSVVLCSGPIWLGLAGIIDHAETVPLILYGLSWLVSLVSLSKTMLTLLASDSYGDDLYYQ